MSKANEYRTGAIVSHTILEIMDANHPMYLSETFEAKDIEGARKALKSHYIDCDANPAMSDENKEYWRNRPHVIVKKTVTTEILETHSLVSGKVVIN